MILNSIEGGKSLINKLMEFGRTQSSKPQWIEPNHLLSATLTMLRGLLGKHIEIEEDFATDIKRISVDPGQLEQVVVNLALNARDAMPQGGTLTVRTRNVAIDRSYAASHPDAALGAHVMIGVQDTGSGMNQETRERLFEPFFSTKPVDKGSGLGLSVVHGIVTQAGGHIEVESEPGQGSLFKLYFPAVE
jgi:signal transduction histidine kinase